MQQWIMMNEKAVDSTTRGPPLSEEPLGALTLGGFLREVCARHGQREALVFRPSRSSGRQAQLRRGLG